MIGFLFGPQTKNTGLTDFVKERFVEIYERTHLTSAYRIDDLLFLVSVMSEPVFDSTIQNPTYWRFSKELLQRLREGYWKVYPALWGVYLRDSSEGIELGATECKRIADELRKEYVDLLVQYNISNDNLAWKNLMHQWVIQKDGYRDILTTVRLYIDIHDQWLKQRK